MDLVPGIRFVTSSKQPGITSDDALAVEALRGYGISVCAHPWDVPLESSCPAILRSPWNYHLKPVEFLSWIDSQRAAIWNHPATVRWNLDKFYLRDLRHSGVPIIPTEFLPRGRAALLGEILETNHWSIAVVKPAISATAHRTWITTGGSALSQQPDLDAMLAESGVLIQQFMPEIQTTGELSLVFFNGVFSHAMQKNAAAGDFRVQEEYGGRTAGIAVPNPTIEEAEQALRATPGAPHLYARVDGIVSGTMFLIMEIELIEPCLYLATNAQAPARFAAAIAERVNQS